MLPFCVLIIEIFFDYKSIYCLQFYIKKDMSIIELIYIRFPNFFHIFKKSNYILFCYCIYNEVGNRVQKT